MDYYAGYAVEKDIVLLTNDTKADIMVKNKYSKVVKDTVGDAHHSFWSHRKNMMKVEEVILKKYFSFWMVYWTFYLLCKF